MYRSKQNEARDFDIFGTCENDQPDLAINEQKYACVDDNIEFEVYDSVRPYMYSTVDYQPADQVEFRVGPCVIN